MQKLWEFSTYQRKNISWPIFSIFEVFTATNQENTCLKYVTYKFHYILHRNTLSHYQFNLTRIKAEQCVTNITRCKTKPDQRHSTYKEPNYGIGYQKKFSQLSLFLPQKFMFETHTILWLYQCYIINNTSIAFQKSDHFIILFMILYSTIAQ